MARRLLLALAVAVLALAAPARSHALSPVLVDDRVPAGYGWVSTWLGLSFGDTVLLSDDGGTNLRTLDGSSEAPVFGIAAHYRTARLDLGVILEGLGSGRFSGLERDFRLGSQFRVAANLRWRYLDKSWGALFIRLAPGLMVFGHSDAVREQAAQLAGAPPLSFERADELSLGFTIGFEIGALVYLSRRLALSFQLEMLTNVTSITALGTDVSYTGIRGIFTVGLEWRM